MLAWKKSKYNKKISPLNIFEVDNQFDDRSYKKDCKKKKNINAVINSRKF